MAVSVLSAAKRLGEKSQWTLTNLHMQKMVYLTHMFYMAEVGSPLVRGQFEAWEFGPVHPELYHALKKYGSSLINAAALQRYPGVPDDGVEAKYLDAAAEQLPRNGLVSITHWSGGAWHRNYRPGVRGIVIPNEHIVDEYRKRKNGAAE